MSDLLSRMDEGLRILSLTSINHLPLSPACEYLHYTFGYSSGYFLALNNTLKTLSSKTFLITEISNICKSNIQKTKIMASGPITSWQIDGGTVETVRDFMFLGSKITADGDCSHEIKRRLLLGRKSYDQPRQYIQKQRHYFANKGSSSQGYGFSCGHVWM